MNRKMLKFLFSASAPAIFLTACATEQLKPADFSATQKIVKEVKTIDPVHAVSEKSFKYHTPPAILEAYKKYITTGTASVVNTDGFIAYPFNSKKQPIIVAQPLQAVDIEFEPGEKIFAESIVPGDSLRWKFTVIKSYNNNLLTYHLMFKPTDWNIGTNVTVGTSKRTYHFKLLSTKDADVVQVKFWYPDEIQRKAVEYIKSQNNDITGAEEGSFSSQPSTIASIPNVKLGELNFNYSMTGDNPPWKPIRIFDDTVHTYIMFPENIRNQDLPVLYVSKHSEKQMVNYRVKGKYFVVDGIYSQLILILGRPGYFFNLIDNRQQQVYITNNKA